jgi:hypothetical protein
MTDRERLRTGLEQIGGTQAMWTILRDIYLAAGYTHALHTLKGWGWTG